MSARPSRLAGSGRPPQSGPSPQSGRPPQPGASPRSGRSPVKVIGAAVVGGALTLAGIAALVLPGPGFVLIAAGLAVLGTQFAWAQRPLVYAKGKAAQGIDQVARSRPHAGFAFVCGVGLLAVGVLGVVGVDIPFLTVASGILLVLSGLFLVGTVVYARRKGPAAPAARTAIEHP